MGDLEVAAGLLELGADVNFADNQAGHHSM